VRVTSASKITPSPAPPTVGGGEETLPAIKSAALPSSPVMHRPMTTAMPADDVRSVFVEITSVDAFLESHGIDQVSTGEEHLPAWVSKPNCLGHSRWCSGVVRGNKRKYRIRLPRIHADFMPKSRKRPVAIPTARSSADVRHRACGLNVDALEFARHPVERSAAVDWAGKGPCLMEHG